MKSSDFHGRMMNISHNTENLARVVFATPGKFAYKCGHRDARHAAAEIANEADARIAELEAQLATSIKNEVGLGIQLAALRPKLADCENALAKANAELAAAQERERAIVELLELDHCFDPHYSMHPVTREVRQDVAKVFGIAAALAAAQQEGK